LLVVGGTFTIAGSVRANRIALWDGAAWSTLGDGFPGYSNTVEALAVLPDGSLVAAGSFITASGANRIARWIPGAPGWRPLGIGTSTPTHAPAALPNGALIAAGDFTTAGGNPASRVARWNGSFWYPLGTGIPNANSVTSLLALPSGDILLGGQF